jgi:hypothetical protein
VDKEKLYTTTFASGSPKFINAAVSILGELGGSTPGSPSWQINNMPGGDPFPPGGLGTGVASLSLNGTNYSCIVLFGAFAGTDRLVVFDMHIPSVNPGEQVLLDVVFQYQVT